MKKRVLAVILGAVMTMSLQHVDHLMQERHLPTTARRATQSVFPSSQSTVLWITVVRDFWKV